MQTEAPRNIFTTIRFLLPELSRTEKRIAEFILENPRRIVQLPLADIAKQCACGEASVIRFCRRIGCSSFSDAKTLITSQLPLADMETQHIQLSGNVSSIGSLARDICSLYVDTLQKTMDLNAQDVFDRAVDCLVRARSIYFFGLGDALIPCMCGYYRFRRIGKSCFFDADADMQMIHAANITSEDVAIAISHSGMTRHVIQAMKAAKDAGASTIGITQTSRSPLTKFCDVLFFNAVSDMTVGKTIVAHRLAESTIIEILYAGVVSQMPEQAKAFLQNSADIMRVNKEHE